MVREELVNEESEIELLSYEVFTDFSIMVATLGVLFGVEDVKAPVLSLVKDEVKEEE